jgi:hypothetical protein
VSETLRAAKTRANEFAKSEPDGEAADVAETIQAMQRQLADLRKLVQAAKTPGDTADVKRRHG